MQENSINIKMQARENKKQTNINILQGPGNQSRA